MCSLCSPQAILESTCPVCKQRTNVGHCSGPKAGAVLYMGWGGPPNHPLDAKNDLQPVRGAIAAKNHAYWKMHLDTLATRRAHLPLAGNGRAGPPLCGRWPIRGLLGLLADMLRTLQARHPHAVADTGLSLSGPLAEQAPSTVALKSRVPCATPKYWLVVVAHPRPSAAASSATLCAVGSVWRRPVWTQWRLRAFSVTRHLAPSLCHKRAQVGREPSLPCPQAAPEFRIPSDCIRVLLLRRLHAPRPGGRLDPLGDHRAACHTAGVLDARGAALERAAARMCRKAGARVATNVFLRDKSPLTQHWCAHSLAAGSPGQGPSASRASPDKLA